jgi:hypothetical protein
MTEDQLREAMSRFAEDVAIPAGLPGRAVRQIRRRRRAAAASVTLSLAAVTAIAVAVTATPARPVQTQTAAYVVSRAESALASADTQDLVRSAHITALGTVTFWGPDGLTGTSVDLWQYSRQTRITFFGPSGRITADLATDSIPGSGYTTLVNSLVNYQDRRWWRASLRVPGPSPASSATPLASPPASTAGSPSGQSCAAGQVIGFGFLDLPDWPQAIRDALACGAYKIVGSQWVDGVDAIKLESQHGLVPSVIWIDPSSYLPVREVQNGGTQYAVQYDFKWLQPIPATLANLSVRVPAGFTEVTPPPTPGFIFGY